MIEDVKNKEINITMKKINLKGNQGTESYSIEVDRNVLISTLKFNFENHFMIKKIQ